MIGSPGLPRALLIRLDTDSDPGLASDARHDALEAIACWPQETIGPYPKYYFRDSTPSGSALPVTFAPRLLSCLRIKRPVAETPARLNTCLLYTSDAAD